MNASAGAPSGHPSSEPEAALETLDLGLERLIFFSDAVMAIAMTLLAIELKVPELASAEAAQALPQRLAEMGPQYASFVISFTVVGIYWMGHHRTFHHIVRYDGRLIGLNLLFLLFITTMPFAAGVLGRYDYLTAGVLPYAFECAALGLSLSAIWWYASAGHRLIDEELSAREVRRVRARSLAVPFVFILSIPLAYVSPWLGMSTWMLAPLSAWLVPRAVVGAERDPASARA